MRIVFIHICPPSLSFLEIPKNYEIYGCIAIGIAFIMIFISLLHLVCIKTTDVGVTLFIIILLV